jgi:hypothetical protein
VQQGGDPDIEGPPAVTAYPEKVQKADKKVQTVATCVLRLLPRGGAAAAAAAAAELTGAAAAPSGSTGASQQDTAAQLDQEEQQEEEDGAGSGEESGEEGASRAGKGKGGKSKAGKAAPLADDGHLYLLVQRPAEGLLAGLWEFPGGWRCC